MRLPLVLTAVFAALSLLLHPAGAPTPALGGGHLSVGAPAPVVVPSTTSAPPSTVPATAPAPVPTTEPAPAPPPPPAPVAAPALPFGTGMWIWLPDRVMDGDVQATVAFAREMGLTHLYVKTGSAFEGPLNADYLLALLPVAHAAGLRVYGWDFPTFEDVAGDLARAMQMITLTTPDGQRLDGFSPDIETGSEGVDLTADAANTYAQLLRSYVGPSYPLIATVPRPSPHYIDTYPYAQVIGPMSAVAPMVYWLDRQPDSDVAGTLQWLAQFGKPMLPIGQAYDGAGEGGREGNPTYDEIQRFMSTAAQFGASAVSFWSWQHADSDDWAAIQQTPPFSGFAAAPTGLAPITSPPPLG